MDRVISAMAESRPQGALFVQRVWKASDGWVEKCGAWAIPTILLCSVCQGASSLPLCQDWTSGAAGKRSGRQETRSDAAGGEKQERGQNILQCLCEGERPETALD